LICSLHLLHGGTAVPEQLVAQTPGAADGFGPQRSADPGLGEVRVVDGVVEEPGSVIEPQVVAGVARDDPDAKLGVHNASLLYWSDASVCRANKKAVLNIRTASLLRDFASQNRFGHILLSSRFEEATVGSRPRLADPAIAESLLMLGTIKTHPGLKAQHLSVS
jgi:hypothetical protein